MKHAMYDVFKDDFDPKMPWRVQFPRGRMPFRTKAEAVEAAERFKAMDTQNRWYDVYYAKQPIFMDPEDVTGENLTSTHTLVKRVHIDNENGDSEAMCLERVYHHMQGEVWSPEGQARPLIEALDLHHTSMSVGDVVKDLNTGQLWGVAGVGFIKLPVA